MSVAELPPPRTVQHCTHCGERGHNARSHDASSVLNAKIATLEAYVREHEAVRAHLDGLIATARRDLDGARCELAVYLAGGQL